LPDRLVIEEHTALRAHLLRGDLDSITAEVVAREGVGLVPEVSRHLIVPGVKGTAVCRVPPGMAADYPHRALPAAHAHRFRGRSSGGSVR
jgi:hypothetical protein